MRAFSRSKALSFLLVAVCAFALLAVWCGPGLPSLHGATRNNFDTSREDAVHRAPDLVDLKHVQLDVLSAIASPFSKLNASDNVDGLLPGHMPSRPVADISQHPQIARMSTPFADPVHHFRPAAGPWDCHGTCCVRKVFRPLVDSPSPQQPPHDANTTLLVHRLSPRDSKEQLADLLFVGSEDRPMPPGSRYQLFREAFLPCLQYGTALFVEAHVLPRFFREVLPRIRVPVVLVSGDSDKNGSYALLHDTEASVDPIVRKRLLAWYAMNCDGIDQEQLMNGNHVVPQQPPFFCLPLGLHQWPTTRESLDSFVRAYGDTRAGIVWTPPEQKTTLLLTSFSTRSNKKVREPLWNLMCNSSATAAPLFATCVFSTDSTEDHYERVRTSKFVLSPVGMGLDCYRTWEALYLGAYVVVKSTSLDSLYAGLPVLIVRDWSEVTKNLLEDTHTAFQRMTFDYRRLFTEYWQREIFAWRVNPNVLFAFAEKD